MVSDNFILQVNDEPFSHNPHAISEEIITFHTFVLHPKMLVKKYFTVTGS